MVRSIISSLAIAGLLLFAAADAEAGKPRQHGSICDEAGLIGSAYGACNAYCDALDCDSLEPGGSKRACEQAMSRFMKLTGEIPPCEPVCPCSAAWRDEGFIDHNSILAAECIGEKAERFFFADLWVVDEANGSVAAVTLAFSDEPDGGVNGVACSASLDQDDPDNPSQVVGGWTWGVFTEDPVKQAKADVVLPASIRPGQRAINGTRCPPS